MPREGDTLEGRYEVTKMLATGGMGVILRAKHLRMGRDVAIKILHPHIAQEDHVVARFEREVRLAQMLNHPNTIRLYDFGEAENGLVYVVMELLDGADLKEIIAEEGPLPFGRAVDLTLQMLDGLGEAHEQDFVHRDLKPSNIFITRDRRGHDAVKILDFGIAKSLEEGGSDLTATGSICGTAAYVAPEYLHDPTPKKSADIYAVGLILLEMLTGRRAFSGTTTAQTLMMQMQRHVQVPSPLAATPLGEVIRKATSKEPSQRYQNADQMFQALGSIADSLPSGRRLSSHQIGDLLTQISGSMPGASGRPPNALAQQLESSMGLPQTSPAPPTGEHSSPKLASTPDAGGFEDDPTIVTPFPAPMNPSASASEQVARRRPSYSQDTMPGNGKSLATPKRKAVGFMVAAVVLVAGSLTAYIMTSPSSDEQTSVELGTSGTAPDKQAEAAIEPPGAAQAIAAPSQAGEEATVHVDGTDQAAPSSPLEFSFESAPEGASVFRGDERLGTTPLDHEFHPGDLPVTLHVEKEGFERAHIDVTVDSDEIYLVELVEVPKSPPEPQRQAEPSPNQVRKPAATKRAAPTKPAKKPTPNDGKENVDEFLDEYL